LRVRKTVEALFLLAIFLISSPAFLEAFAGDAEVGRNRNLQGFQMESEDADVTRFRNLQMPDSAPNNADATRYRNLQSPLSSPNNADVIRPRNLQSSELASMRSPRACLDLSADPSKICETSGESSRILAKISDQLGNPMPEIPITFASSEGTLSLTHMITDSYGEAEVTLNPSSSETPVMATVYAYAEGIEASVRVLFYPPPNPPATNWKTSSQFNVKSSSISFSQYLRPFVYGYNLLSPLQPIDIGSLDNLPSVGMYIVSQSSSANQTTFSQTLHQFLGITTPDNFEPIYVVIVELPLVPIMNTLFGSDIHGPISLPMPSLAGFEFFFDAQNITTTRTGELVLAFTFSKAADARQGINDILQVIADRLISVRKTDEMDLVTDGVNILRGLIEMTGDITVSIITSELDETGQLNSYAFLDVIHVADALSTIVNTAGMIRKALDLLASGAAVIGSSGIDIWADIKVGIEVADLGLEVLPYCPNLEFLQDNEVYETLSKSVTMIVSMIDPERTSIVPSFYNSSGTLVLGYNSSSQNIIYASAEGALIPEAGDWIAYLKNNSKEMTRYLARLNVVGGNASVPYDFQILSSNQNVSSIVYSGMTLGETTLTIPVTVEDTGVIVEQIHLTPELRVSEAGNVFNFVATGLLSNGTLAQVDKAFLIINGSKYDMTPQNSSTLEIQMDLNSPEAVQFSIYMISRDIPGGYATHILLHDLTLSSVTTERTLVGRGYSTSINATIKNQGSFDETFNVTFYANGTVINTLTDVPLVSDKSLTITSLWNTTNVAKGIYAISAQIDLVSHDDLDDNIFIYGYVIVTIAGDITGATGQPDGKVDMRDIGMLCSKFMSTPSNPNWNPNYDINGDDLVNMRDIGIACGNFGKSDA
jgi:hypothetical protein